MKKIIRQPILLLLCAVMALSACLAGCNSTKNEANFPVALSDTTRSALELNTDIRKDSELGVIYQTMLDGSTVKQLNDAYPIRCLRRDDDGYRVIYWGNKRILALRFDNEGNWIRADRLHSIFRMMETRGRLDKLKVGDDVTKVQQADPTCYFPFLVDKSSTDLQTNHYTEDGYYAHITYDKDFIVTSVAYELM